MKERYFCPFLKTGISFLMKLQDCKSLKKLHLRIVHFFEVYKEKGLISTLYELFYLKREVILVKMDLFDFRLRVDSLKKSNMEPINISGDNFDKLHLIYPLRNRYLKALNYIKKGYEAFAIVNGKEVLGDLWYITSIKSKQNLIHPDLKLLKIHLGENEVYGFDMYVKSEKRGNFLAVSLLGGAMYKLGEKGFSNLYAYVVADNIPALWLHRILRFKELKRLKMQRLLFMRRSKMVN